MSVPFFNVLLHHLLLRCCRFDLQLWSNELVLLIILILEYAVTSSRCCVRIHVLVHIAERASRFPPKTKSDFGGRVKCTQLDCGSEKYCFKNFSPSFAVRRTMHLLHVNCTHLVCLVLHP